MVDTAQEGSHIDSRIEDIGYCRRITYRVSVELTLDRPGLEKTRGVYSHLVKSVGLCALMGKGKSETYMSTRRTGLLR